MCAGGAPFDGLRTGFDRLKGERKGEAQGERKGEAEGQRKPGLSDTATQ
jgi:hypothetical protein